MSTFSSMRACSPKSAVLSLDTSLQSNRCVELMGNQLTGQDTKQPQGKQCWWCTRDTLCVYFRTCRKLWVPHLRNTVYHLVRFITLCVRSRGQSEVGLSSNVTVNIVQWPSAPEPSGCRNLTVEHRLSQREWRRATPGWDRKQLLSLCQRDGKTRNSATLSPRANHISQSSISSRTAICRQEAPTQRSWSSCKHTAELTNFSLRLLLSQSASCHVLAPQWFSSFH